MQERYQAVVLGSSGLVAQRLQQRLMHHPMFTLSAVAGSSERAGSALLDIPWRLDDPRPQFPPLQIADIHDHGLPQRLFEMGIRVAFSALPSEQAQTLEPHWASSGIAVFSNASAHRGKEGVPLVIPEINSHDLRSFGQVGYPLACATNCTLLPLILPLAPLNQTFGLTQVKMRSEQAISGGGYRLMDEINELKHQFNPEISGEAEKTAAELKHILAWDGPISIRCERVRRNDGHHVFVEATFDHAVTPNSAKACLEAWNASFMGQSHPSAPIVPLHIVEQIDIEKHLFSDGLSFEDAPNPALDLQAGMGVVVGAISCPNPHTVCFEGYSHNTLRGAAGGVIYLAELAASMDLF